MIPCSFTHSLAWLGYTKHREGNKLLLYGFVYNSQGAVNKQEFHTIRRYHFHNVVFLDAELEIELLNLELL